MNVPLHSIRHLALAITLSSAFLAHGSEAAVLVESWRRDSGSAIVSGLTTAAPSIGTGAANSANATLLSSPITAVSLATVGDKITFTGNVTFAGLGGTLQYGFRWGLFNTNGSSTVNSWLGYYAENGSADKPGRLWERNASGTGSWWSATGATQRNGSLPVDGAVLIDGNYKFTLSVELVATNEVLVNWSLVGAGTTSYSVSGSYLDTTPETLTFNRVGIGNAGFNASLIEFSDVSIATVPEGSTTGMLGASLLIGMIFLRRRHLRLSL